MNNRGSAMISLIAAVLILAFLSVTAILLLPRYTQINTGPDGQESTAVTDPIDMANSIASQANMKSIEIGLQAYFAENGYYPTSLEELKIQGYLNPEVNTASFGYLVCDSNGGSALIFSGNVNSGTYLDLNGSTPVHSSNCP